jgi:hypothetical protein
MAFAVIQTGATLALFNPLDGSLIPLTLPAGITLRTDIPPRWAVYGKYAILVNTPEQPLTIDALGVVRILSPKAPRTAAVLSAVAGGTLTGTYGSVRYTFVTRDLDGNIISESDFSPPSNAGVVVTNGLLRAANLDISPDQITSRRVYRPVTLGTDPIFPWVELDGNVLTAVQDDLSDALLSTLPPANLGTPPPLTLIAEYRDRLWGVGRTMPDSVVFTEAGLPYAWFADNELPIPRVGSDARGVTAFLPRRDALGCGRANRILQITGTSNKDFRVVIVTENCGVISQESVAVYRDVAYFLWDDGVYSWGAGGLSCLTDGSQDNTGVSRYFTSDDFFNRSRFPFAFGAVDPIRGCYRLHLASVGTPFEDSWVEYDLDKKIWFGPHRTEAFQSTSLMLLSDADDVIAPVVGTGGGNLTTETEDRHDEGATGLPIAIIVDGVTKRHDAGEPDDTKYWGELSMIGEAQASGTITIEGSVGDLNAPMSYFDQWDLTLGRQRLGRLGVGAFCQLRFRNDELDVDTRIAGYEIKPIETKGRR